MLLHLTSIWFVSRMDHHMCLEVSLLSEWPVTDGTQKVFNRLSIILDSVRRTGVPSTRGRRRRRWLQQNSRGWLLLKNQSNWSRRRHVMMRVMMGVMMRGRSRCRWKRHVVFVGRMMIREGERRLGRKEWRVFRMTDFAGKLPSLRLDVIALGVQ